VAHLAEILDAPSEIRTHVLLEVLLLEGLVHLAGDLERQARLLRDLDRPVASLVGAHAPEE
jgi:hypothetical protein